jgi:hypothetical protein
VRLGFRVGVLGIFVALMSTGCEDKSIVRIDDPMIMNHPPECLALEPIWQDPDYEKALRKIFPFDPKCPYRLAVELKDNIHCNSNQNSDRKALSAFPNSYLRMEIRHGMRTVYSYYIDLTQKADFSDIEDGISRIKKDLFKK